ncbi:hypothetical protein BTM25_22000 [Actinomadura rubteroloni]|uniref:Uncharacterized protein n=1 Tax=Actinomadura rubteroloni TaxID=1926885 RepID=A0A2P4URV5_9ACTN|nr:DUF6221 family protein [Actinomadura rubteroloni]POM27779.1 hypothetical protein BTM25_22000 [Actinomadura rubteroloni]
MTRVVERFLDPLLARDARFSEDDLDDLLADADPVPDALERHLRMCARLGAAWHRTRQAVRARANGEVLRLLAFRYADEPGYRPSWRPPQRQITADDDAVRFLRERWDEERSVAEEAECVSGADFLWKEIEVQDGQGLVLDGDGRSVFGCAVYPEVGRGIVQHAPGRVLRDIAAREGILARADPALRELLLGTYAS